MSIRLKFFLDNTLVDNPKGWEDWTGQLDRDQEKRGIISIEQGRFEFTGSAYQLLSQARLQGFCSTISVTIQEDCTDQNNWRTAFEGLIFVSDIEFNITKCSATCELVDNSFYARIDNNKSVEASINAGKSKNGLDIDTLDIWRIEMFVPCDGTLSGLPKPKAYRVHDVGSYLIDFMTDGLVGFRSTVLDIGGEFEGMMLTKGLMIRTPSTNDVGLLITWEDYLRNVGNLCNLSFKIDYSNVAPVIVLEKSSDLFENTVLFNFENVDEIKRQIDQARNYAAVELGSDDIIESLGCGSSSGLEPAFPDQINLIGCKREQYAVTGTCNIDSVKDLTADWIISSNVVENIHINGDDRYDDSIIVLDVENLNTLTLEADAIQGDVFGSGTPVFYNSRYFNYQVVNRHLRGIPSTLVKYLNQPETGFKAKRTGTEVITSPPITLTPITMEYFPFPFGDDFTAPDLFDQNNDYGNGTLQGNLITQANSRFTSPFDNVYAFRVTMKVVSGGGSTPPPAMIVIYERYDASNTLLAQYPVVKLYPAGNYLAEQFDSPLIFLAATDYIKIRVNWVVGNAHVLPPQDPVTFELISTGQQGGVFQVYNPEEYIADLVKFKAPMTRAEFWELKTNPTKKIVVSDGRNTVDGWLESVTYKFKTGIAEFTLITTS